MTTPDPSATSHVAAVARVKALLPVARAMGPDGCERMATRHANRGNLQAALLWHAAACLVAYELSDTPAGGP